MTARDTRRAWNFSAGPAMLPAQVLEKAAAEMLDWHGSGMGVMEMSHRGKEFISICEQAESDLRELLAVPAHFKVLFMQGGGLGENAIVPMNLSRGGVVDFVVTGSWSRKSLEEAGRYCTPHMAASVREDALRAVPDPATWSLHPDASYVHVCTNETIHGVEFAELPDLASLGSGAPLVIDCSSHIGSRPFCGGYDWSRVGLAFAGAQKNIGPAGLTIVIVREDLLGHALPICPSAFNYKTVAEHGSMYNTPPTWGIYMAGLVFQWIKAQGGVAEMERRSIAKAGLLYDTIDRSSLYESRVAPGSRSRMNVPFYLRDESRNEAFLAGARERGIVQVRGHKSVGGMRASIYNAMPIEGVQVLVDYMNEFEQRHA